MNYDTDVELMNLLAQIGVIADSNQCMLCGVDMKKHTTGAHWFWICRRRFDGVTCQRKQKKSKRTGTMFECSKLSIQCTL